MPGIEKRMKKGHRHVRDKLDVAMIDDINMELNHKSLKNPDKNLNEAQKLITILLRFLRLKVITSNLNLISYCLMISIAMTGPGLLTLVYPFFVFGYAALLERGPSNSYWYFIVFYT